jgi:argininosuccinate synthase
MPVALNGERMGLVDMIVRLNQICGKHGYGRIDMVENRVVGIKSHECYECPASLAIINMHQALETLCLDAATLQFKHGIDQQWAKVVYDGLWFSQLKEALDAFCADTQKCVTGEVKAKLYKGSLTVIGRRSKYSLYDYGLATYGDGDTFDRTASKGFIDLHSLPSKTWSTKQGPAARGEVATGEAGSSRETPEADSAEGDPSGVTDTMRNADEKDADARDADEKAHAAA